MSRSRGSVAAIGEEFGPLIRAVGAVDEFDERMSVSRPWGQPRLAPTPCRSLPPRQREAMQLYDTADRHLDVERDWQWDRRRGSSARPTSTQRATSPVYGMAQDQPPAGAPSDRTEFCLGHPKRPCEAWPFARASLCRALNGAVPKAALPCRPPAKIPTRSCCQRFPRSSRRGHLGRLRLSRAGLPLVACRLAQWTFSCPKPSSRNPASQEAASYKLTMSSVLGRSIGTVRSGTPPPLASPA